MIVYALIGQALEEGGSEEEDDPEDKSDGPTGRETL